MANKRITDLCDSGTLRGDEKFIIDQATPSCISGQDTVQTNLTDIQSFVLTNAPLISATGNMEIDGRAIFNNSVEITGELATQSDIKADSIEVRENVSTTGGQFISAGEDLFDIFFTGLSGLGNLQQITDNGSTTPNAITADAFTGNTFDILEDTEGTAQGYLSGGVP